MWNTGGKRVDLCHRERPQHPTCKNTLFILTFCRKEHRSEKKKRTREDGHERQRERKEERSVFTLKAALISMNELKVVT